MKSLTPHTVQRQAPPRISVVTFKQFAALARQRSWTAQSLAERFRGRIENPTEFFHRVLTGKAPDNLVPYRSVVELFARSQKAEKQGVCIPPAGKVHQTSVNDLLEYV